MSGRRRHTAYTGTFSFMSGGGMGMQAAGPSLTLTFPVRSSSIHRCATYMQHAMLLLAFSQQPPYK